MFSLKDWVKTLKAGRSGTRPSRRRTEAAPGRRPDDHAAVQQVRVAYHPLRVEYLEERVVPSVNPTQPEWTPGPRLSALGDARSLSADLAAVVPLSSYAAFAGRQPALGQVVFVDAAVPDYAALVTSIGRPDPIDAGPAAAGDNAAGPVLRVSRSGDTGIVVLDSRFDGAGQITGVLREHHGLAAEQVVSHGGPGELLLGNVVLDEAWLRQNPVAVTAWGEALKPGGDILLYGCDVAQGDAGARFVQQLADVAGADVAASIDPTGGAARGGNWELEYRTGPIEATPALTVATAAAYSGTLGFDLPTYIQDLLAGRSASFTITEPAISTASLGGFLELNNVTLTGSATLTNGTWSGSVSVSASSATLFPGSTFSAAVTPATAGQPAVIGTYTIGAGYSLTAGRLSLNVGEALAVGATGVTLAYNPAATGPQTLATVANGTVTSAQFSAMPAATLTNFKLRTDGFQFDSFALPSAAGTAPGIGSFLTADGVTLSVSALNATFGTGVATPTLTGTVGVAVTGPKLYPAGGLVQLQSTAVTAAYDFSGFDGTAPTGKLGVTVSGFKLAVGDALLLSAGATPVTLTPGAAVLATVPSLTLSSPNFAGLGTTTVTDLVIGRTGFTIGSLGWSTTAAVSVGGDILTFASTAPAGSSTPRRAWP